MSRFQRRHDVFGLLDVVAMVRVLRQVQRRGESGRRNRRFHERIQISSSVASWVVARFRAAWRADPLR
jgi:hypothetical protein